VAPWPYEQLAIVYRKLKDREAELGILERFAEQQHPSGVAPVRLLERLRRLRQGTLPGGREAT
jgi:hypothetical protein